LLGGENGTIKEEKNIKDHKEEEGDNEAEGGVETGAPRPEKSSGQAQT